MTISPDGLRSAPETPPASGETVAAAFGVVWPVATLFGATAAASGSLAAWLVAPSIGGARPWGLFDWVAEHALWGTALGALLALVLRVGARWDRTLLDPAQRRAAAARVVSVCVALVLLGLAGALAGGNVLFLQRAASVLAAAGAAVLALWWLLGRGLAGSLRVEALPRLDPPRVAVAIALLTLPLAEGARRTPAPEAPGAREVPASLVGAWQVMLGR